jgi:cytochrome c oxidase assembly protein subunit 15
MRITAERYRRFAVASLLALFVVIVAGAAVRLTDSGLGCDDWPNCNATSFVDVSSRHAAIEQINRLFNGIVTVAVLVVGALSHRVTPRRAGVVGLAWTLVALVAANAVLGGISVRVDLHPVAIQGHLLLALAAVVVNMILIELCSDRPPRPAVSPAVRGLVAAVAVGTGAAIVVGTLVTGSGPHAGDESAERLDASTVWSCSSRSPQRWLSPPGSAGAPTTARWSATPSACGCSWGSCRPRSATSST